MDNSIITHISERIYKKFKSEKEKSQIIDKINKFAVELCQNHANITSLSKGFWTKSIVSCPNRYKLRVNNKDRIVFEYGRSKNEIYFLDYCNHDEQIRTAKNIINTMAVEKLEIDKSVYVNEAVDNYIDEESKELAYDFIEGGNYYAALELLKKTGDVAAKKTVNYIIETGYDKYKEAFYKWEYQSIIAIKPSRFLKKEDILRILNRIYSEYHVILSPYYTIKYATLYVRGFTNKVVKKITDYNSDLAEAITLYVKNMDEEFYILGCLYGKYGTESVLAMGLSCDMSSNSLEKLSLPRESGVWRVCPIIESFDEVKAISVNFEKMAKRNLGFIFERGSF